MAIKRHPQYNPAAFTGDYYIVSDESGFAIESWATEAEAERGANYLNAHNAKVGHTGRFKVIHEPSEVK